jgi:hypothetical protein
VHQHQCMQLGYTGEARWSRASAGAPKQAAEAASSRAEAMPSSRGDARATGRTRTGGAKSPGRKVFPDPLTANGQSLRLRLGAKVYLEIRTYESPRAREQLPQPKASAGLNKLATRTARGLFKPVLCFFP